MDNVSGNISVTPVVSRKWYEIWRDVWLHPSSNTFRSMLADPSASASRGFTWVAVTELAVGVLGALLELVLLGSNATGGVAGTLVCGIIVAPIASIIGLAISAGIYHGTALIFKGAGTWSQLVYCFAAIQAPYLVIGTLLNDLSVLLISSRGLLLVCAGLIGLAVGIYSLVLYVCAIDGVENFGTGKAVLTAVLPTVVILALVFCAFGSLLAGLLSSYTQ